MPYVRVVHHGAHRFAFFCFAAWLITPAAARRHASNTLALRKAELRPTPSSVNLSHINGSTVPNPCEKYASFILSANTEFVKMSGSHLMAMIVDALQPSLTFAKLRDPNNLDAKANWEQVSEHIRHALSIDILIFACQECNFNDNPLELLQSEARLGDVFERKVSERFFITTKFPIPSKMFIGALVPKTSKCFPSDLKATEVSSGNKGAVMVYVKTPLMNIAFVGAHLDASSPEKRKKNIRMIMAKLGKGYKQTSFDHIYIFGDLNYRLKALPAGQELEKDCETCIAGDHPDCNSTDCKWCHKKYVVNNGKCIAKGTKCPSNLPTKVRNVDLLNHRYKFLNAMYEIRDNKFRAGPVRETCQTPYADYFFYFNAIFRNHSTEGHKPNRMYELVKEFDTLYQNLGFWKDFGFAMPDYTANVAPTYKKEYKQGKFPLAWSPAESWYNFQTLLERGGPLADVEGELASTEDLMDAVRNGAYQLKTELKACEFEETGCLDFGWLDRMMYYEQGTTIVHVYRTLKMHVDFGAGDHSPLFMLLWSV